LYQAFVWGVVEESNGTIKAPVGRSSSDRKKMAVTWQRCRTAITHFTVVERSDFISQLSLKLETGRTHQIRVHLSHIGHPVLGDPQYGGRNKRLKSLSPRFRPLAESILGVISRQVLHAAGLGFVHPQTGKYLEFNVQMPADMKRVKEMLTTQ
jgi:23S rRNA pseudouridine1911/1915/1917 synthase